MAKIHELIQLCEMEEDFQVIQDVSGKYQVKVYDHVFPLNHPVPIHLRMYREMQDPAIKCKHLIAAHHLLWPEFIKTWNYWDDRTFRAMCEDWRYISLAGGGSTGKSHRMARLAWLFYMANPKKRLVITATTTLSAGESRIWGYITGMMEPIEKIYNLQKYRGNNPRVLYEKDDPRHGMYLVAAAKGTSQKSIANWIGKHPDEALLLILDESPDLDPILLDAIPNLESPGIEFKCVPIGNSASRNDLHGALSTPKNGWHSISRRIVPGSTKSEDLEIDTFWETTQKRSCCLFFNCYESPAIHEPNLIKRKALEKFLINTESIEEKKDKYGEDSIGFWRFVVGFWREESTESSVITERFLSHYNVTRKTEWSGIVPLQICAGIDPAFSTGGDNCMVRLAVLGQEITGKIVLDFMYDRLLFKIPVLATSNDSAELQVTKGIIEVLNRHQCPFENVALNITGVGRALGELLRIKGQYVGQPVRIISVPSGRNKDKSFDAIPMPPLDMWAEFRNFIQHDQLRGLDAATVQQITSRLTEWKGNKEVLESKQAYKRRMAAIDPKLAHSPDEADATALTIQAAIRRLGFTPGAEKPIPDNMDDSYKKLAAFDLQQYREAEKARKSYVPSANFSRELAAGAPFMNKTEFK